MNFKRITSFLLVLISVLTLLVSCNGNTLSDETTDNGLSETTSPDETTSDSLPIVGEGFVTVFSEGKLNFSGIKHRENPGEDEFGAIKKLRDRINKETGEQISCSPDYSSESRPADSSTYEILIGQTNYPESKEVLSTLSSGDYAIKIVGNKLVINAHKEGDILRAVNYILNTMFEDTITEVNGHKTVVISEYSYTGEKPLSDVLIDGNSVRDYAIVYFKGNNKNETSEAESCAQMLWNIISEKTGIVLEVASEKEAVTKKNKIYIGIDIGDINTGNMSYAAKIKDGNYYISADGYMSLYLGINDIIVNQINTRPVDRKVSLSDSEKCFLKVRNEPISEDAEFRVMTYNIMAQWTGWGGDYMPVFKRYEAFKGIIDVYSPDVIGLQEVSSQWSEKIRDELTDYDFVNRVTPDGKFVNLTTIIYKRNKFEIVDTGLKYFTINGPTQIRLVNWAIFRDKATGKKFAFFNSHWGPSGEIENYTARRAQSYEHAEIINEVMAAHPDVKYGFSTADYNTGLTDVLTYDFLSISNFTNTLDIAKASGNLKNEVGGCGELGVSRENNRGGGSIDNIFSTKNVKVLRHETILWSAVEHISDHSPKYADVVLN